MCPELGLERGVGEPELRQHLLLPGGDCKAQVIEWVSLVSTKHFLKMLCGGCILKEVQRKVF